MSLSHDDQLLYQRLVLHNLADRPISENDKIDMLDAYKVYFDTEHEHTACCWALDTCGLEDPEYKKLNDELSEAEQAREIAWNNYVAIRRRLFP
uniref:Uncharacterized protein n=1 Tax=viral metagenome TaxID=1070528 RepID=A0A6C0JYV8_9ZZZZ